MSEPDISIESMPIMTLCLTNLGFAQPERFDEWMKRRNGNEDLDFIRRMDALSHVLKLEQ